MTFQQLTWVGAIVTDNKEPEESVMMLTHLKMVSFVLSVLVPNIWPRIASRVTQSGQLAEHENSSAEYSVSSVTRLQAGLLRVDS